MLVLPDASMMHDVSAIDTTHVNETIVTSNDTKMIQVSFKYTHY